MLLKTYSQGVLATCQTFLDHAKQSGTDALKLLQNKVILKTTEAIRDLIDSKIANKITKISTSLQNISGTEMKRERLTMIKK